MALSFKEKPFQWITPAREKEQQQITQDLNDYMLQALESIDQQLSSLYSHTAEVEHQNFSHIQNQLHTILDITRSICTGIRSGTGAETGILATLSTWLGALERQAQIHVTLTTAGDLEQLSQEVVLYLFHVLQEALSNIRKHARASHVAVHVQMQTYQVTVIIEDDGRGFHVPQELGSFLTQHRFGLIDMCERIAQAGGSLQIRSAPDSGTQVCVILPHHPSPPSAAPARDPIWCLQQPAHDPGGRGQSAPRHQPAAAPAEPPAAGGDTGSSAQQYMPPLSAREVEVLHLLVEGKSNQEIADSLCISERTARFHLKNIYEKLQMRRSEVIAWGARHRLGMPNLRARQAPFIGGSSA